MVGCHGNRPKSKEGGWGWMVVTGGFCIFCVFGAVVRLFGVYYIAFLERYDATATTTAWAIAVTSICWTGSGLYG